VAVTFAGLGALRSISLTLLAEATMSHSAAARKTKYTMIKYSMGPPRLGSCLSRFIQLINHFILFNYPKGEGRNVILAQYYGLKACNNAPHSRLTGERSGIASPVQRLVMCWYHARSLLA